MNELVSVNTILDWMRDNVESKTPISPSLFVDAAGKLVVLIGDENDKLFDLQQKVAMFKSNLIASGHSVAKANVESQALDDYKELCKQKAKVEQIWEFVRIAKLRARLTEGEYKSGI